MHWRGLIVDTLEGIFILQKLRICMYFRWGGEGGGHLQIALNLLKYALFHTIYISCLPKRCPFLMNYEIVNCWKRQQIQFF